jgi:hypothetical protein
MATRAYAWRATNGGIWSLASNWSDLTDGISPSLTLPGPEDSVAVAGASGSVVQTMTGQGDVLAASFTGNTALAGSFTIATVTLGGDGNGGLLDIGTDTTLSAGTIILDTGSLFANGTDARLMVSAGLTAGQGQSGTGAAQANLYATSGAAIQTASLTLNASSATLYVDPTSSIEIGTLGGATSGALTIDEGATLSGQGDANAYGAVINNGTILAEAGLLLTGTLTGQGTLAIAAGAELALYGQTGAGQAVAFVGAAATLAWQTEFDAPSGTITGFTTGDAFDVLGSPISAATYASTGSNLGILTLLYGGQTADTLTLAGAYSNDVFLTASDGAGGTLIFVTPNVSANGSISAGTATQDVYQWSATAGGAWNAATNWIDSSAGQNPAKIAPGAKDNVTIAAPQTGAFAVIAGPADANQLAITGDLGLAGAFALGTLTLGTTLTAATLDLLPTAAITAQTAAIANGAFDVSGRATVAIAGTLTLGGGISGIGLPITALSATAGGAITAAALVMGGGSGDSLTTDPTASIEIGTANHPNAGAITIDAGASLTGNGDVNPYGSVIDNGTITASGGVLVLGTATGNGALAIASSAGLLLDASTALNLSFGGTTGTLAVEDERVSLTGTIAGFAPGDTVDIENDQITATSNAYNGTNTTVSLYYGSTLVSALLFAGSYSADRFVLLPDGADGTDIQLSPNGSGGGNPGQGTTDTLQWASPVSGAWAHAGNWFDVTTGKAATAAPGTQNTVELIGPTGNSFQTIGGPAACATLGIWGNSLLTGAYTTANLTIGGTVASTSATTGTLVLAAAATLATSSATLTGGAVLLGGTGAAFTTTGTLMLGVGAAGADDATTLIAATNHAAAQFAGLILGGGAGNMLTTDTTASIEIGTLGGATAGAITIDPGFSASGNGALNPGGLVIDNGTITAQGGTLALGTLTGAGMLAIGAEATLALTTADSAPIDLTGAGATLLLPGSALLPGAPITGFTQGDFIITGESQISSVTYTPGAGGVGTLTLLYGSEIAGTLLLAGNYAGASFTVQAAGAGSAITVQTTAAGPSQGTTTPDDYLWTGSTSGAWNVAANWQDTTAGQTPAEIAPGAQDLVSINAGTTGFTTISGPANAASLAITGEVALLGQYAIGALAIGGASSTGVLALGQGSAVQTASITLTGGLELQSASLSDTGTLSVSNGVVAATGQALIDAAAAALTGGTLATDSTGAIEIGTAADASAGAVTIDPGATLAGTGLVNAAGSITDNGTLAASGGTLLLGTLTGTGTLQIGPAATLDLLASAAASLCIDFTGPGTLAAATTPSAAIGDFGAGDQILLPFAADTALYAATGAGIGTLTLTLAGQTVATLTLLGVGQSQTFTVTPQNGGSLLTTITQPWDNGDPTMTSASGTSQTGSLTGFAFWESLNAAIQQALSGLVGGAEVNLFTSTIGDSVPSWATANALDANIALVTAPGADTKVVLPSAYVALIAQGETPVILTDAGQGNALIAGNDGADTIVGFGSNDTLASGTGGSVIYANGGEDVIGGGNDTICTGSAASTITTSLGGKSVVFLSTGYSGYQDLSVNQVTSQGDDIIVAGGTPADVSNSIVNASGKDTVFGPAAGQLVFNGGAQSALLVAAGGTVIDNGGAGNGSVLWSGTGQTVFNGGAGSAIIVGGSGDLLVSGGAGPLTVYGGAGQNDINAAAGPSTIVTGIGASTVSAATGNHVWLAGAANNSLVAGNGNILFQGAASSGDNFFNLTGETTGNVTVYGGSGEDTVEAGAGNATIHAGNGGDIFMFTNGLTGGAVAIDNFNPGTDQLNLQGYGGYTNAVVNGSEVITLSDGTSIQLIGITSLPTGSILTS